MDASLAEIYSTVLPAAPYVIAAYAGIWIVLLAFVAVLARKASRTRADVKALREALDRRERERDGR